MLRKEIIPTSVITYVEHSGEWNGMEPCSKTSGGVLLTCQGFH